MTESGADVRVPWALRAVPVAIESTEAHVWAVTLDDRFSTRAELDTILTDDERERARQFVPDAPRVRFRIARAALRLLLGAYAHIEPSRLAFEYTALRRPVLAPEQGVDIRFNVAHADDLALIAFVRGTDVGVDIERRRSVPDAAALAANYFTPVEARDIAGLTGSAQSDAFLRCWTRKEAVTKATGEGLTRSFGSFSVPLDDAMPSRVVDLADALAGQPQLTLHALTPDGRYAAALALGPDVTRVRSFTLDLDGALHARRG